MTLNINPKIKDTFYRYKMEPLQIKLEGRDIVTKLVNIESIQKSLSRHAHIICKYFAIEIGCKLTKGCFLQGKHDVEKLQKLLFNFITKFVCCLKCENPETNLSFVSNQLYGTCMACGACSKLDNNHKIVSFISKNQKLLISKVHNTPKKKEEIVKTPTLVTEPSGDSDDEDWCEDTSEDAVQKRQEEWAIKKESPFKLFFEKARSFDTLKLTPKDLFNYSKKYELGDKAIGVLVEVFYDEHILDKNGEQIKVSRPYLLKFSNKKSQPYFIGALERFIIFHGLACKAGQIFELLYEQDLLSEQAILEWYKNKSYKYVKREEKELLLKSVSHFVMWLETAEEESSSDEDEKECEIDIDSI